LDDRRIDGGTNFILRIKEQGTHLTLNERDDDDDYIYKKRIKLYKQKTWKTLGGFELEFVSIIGLMYYSLVSK
jgi:hypothetical protein